MAITVTKKFEFEACHRLNNYDGPCARMHGHTYKLEITIEGKADNNGMIMDFNKVKAIVQREVIDQMDHFCLNDIKGENGLPIFEQPTAENMVLWIAHKLAPEFAKYKCALWHVRLYETSNSHADWYQEMY